MRCSIISGKLYIIREKGVAKNLTPLELLYYIGYSAKKRYVRRDRKQLPYPVVSIGNITVGGTGKTPATIAVAKEARRRGFSPIVLTRGYLGKAKGPCVVAPKKFPLRNFFGNPHAIIHSIVDAGDEPVLMAGRLKDIPVVKSTDRYRGGIFALQSFSSQTNAPFLFVLDDGFQHWGLSRDIDIVLIDGLDPFGNRKMLPLGPLRGPLEELKSADVFVITKARNEAVKNELMKLNPGAPLFFSEHRVERIRNSTGREFTVRELKEKRVYGFCGIANPDSFKHTVLSLPCELAEMRVFRDHYRYAREDLLSLERRAGELHCDFLIATEKDMVKLEELGVPENVLCLEIGFTAEAAFFESIFSRLL